MKLLEIKCLLQAQDFVTARYNGVFYLIGYWASNWDSLRKICTQAAIVSLNTEYIWRCIQNGAVQICKCCTSVHISDIYVGRGAIPGEAGSESHSASVYGQSASAFVLSCWPGNDSRQMSHCVRRFIGLVKQSIGSTWMWVPATCYGPGYELWNYNSNPHIEINN